MSTTKSLARAARASAKKRGAAAEQPGKIPSLAEYTRRGYPADTYESRMVEYRAELAEKGITPIEPSDDDADEPADEEVWFPVQHTVVMALSPKLGHPVRTELKVGTPIAKAHLDKATTEWLLERGLVEDGAGS